LDLDSTRYITEGGGFASSSRNGNQIFGALVTGYDYRYADWLIAPYGRLEMMTATLDQTTEAASNLNALTYFKQTIKASRGTLGLRVEDKYRIRTGILTPYARVEFSHRFEGANRATLAYADLASVGPIYSLDTLELNTGNWIAGIGARLAMHKGLMLTIDYTSNINQSNAQNQTIFLGVNIPIH
jgi:outer membrane autotransporter protein